MICRLNADACNVFILKPVFRIHDILVWIRIRGSMPLINGSGYGSEYGSGSFYFINDLQDANKKLIFLKVFLYITFLRYLCILFKNKKVKKMSQNSRNQGFSYYICLMIEHRRIRIRIQSRIRIRIHTSDEWIRIREAQKHVDPVDPDSDPEHCLKLLHFDTFAFCDILKRSNYTFAF
jgi:hypothetical protein